MSQPSGPSGWEPPQSQPASQPQQRPTQWEPPPATYGSAAGSSVCYRHPNREAHIVCQRCGRPICPDCMVPAAVGFQCPECVREGSSATVARSAFGGRSTLAKTGTVSKVLIGLNLIIFAAQYLLGSRIDMQWAMLPGPALMSDGSVAGVASGEYWRLLTGAFLHGGMLHMAVNMFSLYQIGPTLEQQLGRARFLAVYLVSALGGSVAVYLFSPPNQLVVGASGAVFGIFGAAIVLWRKLGYDIRPAFAVLAINVVINIVGASYLSWQGHLGGIITGVLVAIGIGYVPGKGEAKRRNQWIAIGGFALALVVLVVVQTARLQVG